jgi:YidC/Oxa1 family membrane protein insertase
MHYIWDLILYHPLLNALALLVSIIPRGDVGIAVIILTILVKLALFPLSQKSIDSQAKMTKLAPELDKIKKSGVSKEEQAKQTFELYKKHKVNPVSGCLPALIQLPIVLALFFVFRQGINFDNELLYSFVHIPENINMIFLGFLDLGEKSLVLAILAGISQYFQAYFMPQPIASTITPGSTPSFSDSFSKSMHMQMKYVFPFVITFIAYTLSGAVALYWITSNIFAIGQQIYVDKKRKDLAINYKDI